MKYSQKISRDKEGLRDATLLFLIKKSHKKISKICLALKKRGFGINRWNGVGGKVEKGEDVYHAAIRETEEEIGVKVIQADKVAELLFYFPHNSAWNQRVHVYFCNLWQGKPSESDEMKPRWFSTEKLPFQNMWPDDKFWVPKVINNKIIKASFVFGEGDVIQKRQVRIVESL